MIKEILIAKEGSYKGEGQKMDGLKKVNFIYEPNGSGKTTISRVLDKVIDEDEVQQRQFGRHCKVTWKQDTTLEVLVYNRDFVAKHFQSDELKGIYTFGDNVDVCKEIKEKSKIVSKLKEDISELNRNLKGENGDGGKENEKANLGEDFTEMCWKAKKRYKDYEESFKGAGTKAGCETRYKYESKNNNAELLEADIIAEKAKIVFSDDLSKKEIIPPLLCGKIIELENRPILSKIVLGKDDVDMAAMITKLGNSDWVQAGIEFYDKNDDYCPFCQQQTTQAFRDSLNEYFDETYTKDLERALSEEN